jgi:hypothetical protein
MRKRPLLLCLALLALVGLSGGLLVLLTHPRHRINQESYERIKEGMTLEEVEAILGGPPGNYTRGRYGMLPYLALPLKPLPRVLHEWLGEEAAIYVWFDLEGRARETGLQKVLGVKGEPSLLDRLRHLLPW